MKVQAYIQQELSDAIEHRSLGIQLPPLAPTSKLEAKAKAWTSVLKILGYHMLSESVSEMLLMKYPDQRASGPIAVCFRNPESPNF